MTVTNHGKQRRAHKLLASWGMSDPVHPGSVKTDPAPLPGYREITCPDCGGSGFETVNLDTLTDESVISCLTCHGTGEVNESEVTP